MAGPISTRVKFEENPVKMREFNLNSSGYSIGWLWCKVSPA